jgi:ABC-type glycerol-3-phosphate transport system substrate-binding protein
VKRFLSKASIALMIAGAAVILAFGPRPKMEAPEGRIRIQYWDKWTGLEGQQMQSVVDAFNQTVGKEKGIWVDFTSMSQIDRKTLIATAAGVPPDVAGLWDVQVLQFASMGALEPLNSYAQQYGLTRDHYKHVFYDGCTYRGTLYAVPSTVFSTALIWNKAVFQSRAAEIRAAGLDPNRAPRTLDELNRYAAAIDTWVVRNGSKHLAVAGYIPLLPDMSNTNNVTSYWFGAQIANPEGTKVLLDTPEMLNAYNWVRSFSEHLGKPALAEFRSGFSSGDTGLFDTPQNPFLVGWISMEWQGAWVSAFIEKLKPSMNRWHVPPDQLQREKDYEKVETGMTLDQVQQLLGPGDSPDHGLNRPPAPPAGSQMFHWLAGIKDLYVTFADGKVSDKQWRWLPAKIRQQYCQWGAAPFPSGVPGKENITAAGMDVWVIPATSKHKNEAMEFIAFASRQDQIEKLSSDHCNLSPLAVESPEYFQNHPNPYVDVFEKLASSPNALGLPRLINWPQVGDELKQVGERSYLLQGSTQQILTDVQKRAQQELNKALDVPADTNLEGHEITQ